MKYMTNEFYCTSCGNRGIPIQRKVSDKREHFHKKKLFCIYCNKEVNHIECRDQFEVETFKHLFAEGAYAND